MVSESVQTIVIGGGISGLAAAHYAISRGNSTLLLERNTEAGGCLSSHRFEQCGGFWAEMGAHTCYNSYGHLLQIMEDCQMLTQVLPKEKLPYRLLAEGQLYSVFARLSWLELARSLPNLFRVKKTGKTVGEFYGAIAGRGNFERVLSPALDAVICQSASDFPADALFRKRQRRKNVVRNFTLPGGVQDVARVISERLGVTLKTGREVTSVAKTETGFTVTTADGEIHHGADLVLATNVTAASRLLTQAFPEIADLLGSIREVEIDTLSLAIPAQAAALEPLAGIIAVRDNFYSMVSRDPMPDGAYRGFTFHFRPGRTDEKARLTRACQVLGIGEDQILDQAFRINRLPSLDVSHADRITEIDARLAGTRLALTGNYFAGVSIEDCLIRSRSEFLRLYPAEG